MQHYPCNSPKEEAQFIADVLRLGMKRDFIKRDDRVNTLLEDRKLSRILSGYVADEGAPKPCRHSFFVWIDFLCLREYNCSDKFSWGGNVIELRAINKDNIEKVLNLNVHKHQKSFVSSTAHSLAQAYVYRDTAYPFAIYANDTLIGFIMLGFYEEKNQYTIWKFLIDKEYQNKGYGKQALNKGIDYLKETFNAKEVYVGVSAGNNIAKKLYSSVGFNATSLIENNTEEMRYICES